MMHHFITQTNFKRHSLLPISQATIVVDLSKKTGWLPFAGKC
jgi:hypothetical protein